MKKTLVEQEEFDSKMQIFLEEIKQYKDMKTLADIIEVNRITEAMENYLAQYTREE